MGKKLTNRSKQALCTKKRIYQGGVKLIEKYGYENVTVDQIAKKAGVSVGTYYHYFQSKFDLFVEIYRQGDEYFKAKVPELLDRHESCASRVIAYFALYGQLSIDDGLEMVRNLYVPTNKMFLTHGRAMQDLLTEILRQGQVAGEIINSETPEKITEQLFVAARGVIFDWSLRDGQSDIIVDMKDMTQRLIGTYLNQANK
ncbi:MAG TPA: TetR/AcrR family transcriptional regulator [Firmicutes bacterium]|jgi:TetR/AcrR family transcriptional regulator, fatty acid metabolism regulator protein|nr:TetR/AcrR family transcriptional regulator [Bacillota bacterium]